MTKGDPGRLSFLPGWLAKALVEATLIVFAVVLGFLVNEWRGNVGERERAEVALDQIVREMESNLAVLREVQPYHQTIQRRLAETSAALADTDGLRDAVLVDVVMPAMESGVQPPLLSDVSWIHANQRGELDALPIEMVENIARIYMFQSEGVQRTWRSIVERTFFTPESFERGDITGRLTFTHMAFRELQSQEEFLIFQYDELLDQLYAERGEIRSAALPEPE